MNTSGSSALAIDAVEIETGPKPNAAVIWLHGLGADGYDFVPIVQELELAQLGPIRFIFPHAPERAITINGGYMMRAWYDIRHPSIVQSEDESGIRQSAQAITELIDRELTRGIEAQRIILAGFSQGCAMSLFTGLRYRQKLAGLIGLSGYQPLNQTLEAERSLANQTVPIFLAHGTSDSVVPLLRGQAAQAQLETLGYACSWRTYAMGHSVCPDEVKDISQFLREQLGKPAV